MGSKGAHIMSWKECNAVSERLEFVNLASKEGANKSALCRRFGISRKTGDKWLKRWRLEGESGLHDRSRRPHSSPGKTPEWMERAVLDVRKDHPSWSGTKIRRRLQDLGHQNAPAASTITEILRRHDLIGDASRAEHHRWQRFGRPEPNDLWQLDFKGEFKLSTGRKCYPLTILDDHSRYSLGIHACGNQRRSTVMRQMQGAFQKYGIPRAIYVDNGNPWGTAYRHMRHTRFSLWLMRQDIEVIHGTPYHPQGRGKLERFHRTFKLELLQGRQFSSLKECQSNFEPWRTIYNHVRPHQSLGLDVPASRYHASQRSFQEATEPYQYSQRFQTRRPNRGGQFKFQGKVYRISEIFNDHPIGLAPTESDGVWDIYYCRFRVGQLSQHTNKTTRTSSWGESRCARSTPTAGKSK